MNLKKSLFMPKSNHPENINNVEIIGKWSIGNCQIQIKPMLIQVVSLIKILLSFIRFQMRKTMEYFTQLSCFSLTEAMNLGWNLWPYFLEACKLISIYPVMTKIFTEIKVRIFMDFICTYVILLNQGKGIFKCKCWDWRVFIIKELRYIISTFWVGWWALFCLLLLTHHFLLMF